MDKGRVVGGIVCLAVAGLLAILSWRLPAEKMFFMAGGVNIPMVILAVAGILLLVFSRKQRAA
jgi:hypothetical protein